MFPCNQKLVYAVAAIHIGNSMTLCHFAAEIGTGQLYCTARSFFRFDRKKQLTTDLRGLQNECIGYTCCH